jgi:DNA-binding response OmpR family regulator
MSVLLTVLVYSDNRATRHRVVAALGRRPAADLAELDILETATAAMVLQRMDSGGVDIAILDGEATPAGGMGIAKQLKDELEVCPPVIVLTGRPTDDWLARWSRADATVPHPVDPAALTAAVVGALRTSGVPRLPAPVSTP